MVRYLEVTVCEVPQASPPKVRAAYRQAPGEERPPYSTVTVLARFRGWSTVAAQARDSVGEQLERHDGERGLQERMRARHVDDVVRVVLDVLVAVGRDRDHLGAARRVSWMFETTLS